MTAPSAHSLVQAVAVALTMADGRQRTLLIGGDGGALDLTVRSAASVPA